MPSIKLITFHTPKNYGAVLQGFSLMSFLKKYDENIKVIDFNTPHLRSGYPIIRKPESFNGFVKYLLTLPIVNQRKKQYAKFESFVMQFFPLTERCESINDLKIIAEKTDYFFTGSDQVFNPNRIEEERKAFYLSFTKPDARCISYAGSFGVKEIPESKKEEIKSYFSRFYKIGVREESGIKIVNDLGYEANEVLDPVFLNDIVFWRQIQKEYKRIPKKEFLLYYRLLGNRKGDKLAKKIARKKGLKLVVISQSFCPPLSNYIFHDVGPQEFLYLYDMASFVVTDSFHGVAFSMIYNKQFVFSDDDIRTYERGYNLLKKAEIEKIAFISDYDNRKTIDYDAVNIKLQQLIDFSKKFIKECLA